MSAKLKDSLTSRDSSRRDACSHLRRLTSDRSSFTTWTLSPRMVALSFLGRSGSVYTSYFSDFVTEDMYKMVALIVNRGCNRFQI